MEKSIYTREHRVVTRLLKELREASGLTQVQLSLKLGLTQSHYSKMERGETRIDFVQLRAFCLAVGTTLPEFTSRFERELNRKK